MELQAASVPISNRFHLQLRLVSVNVIDEVQIDFREIFENRVVAGVMHLIAGKENSFVTAFVDQRVGCVAVLEEIGNLIWFNFLKKFNERDLTRVGKWASVMLDWAF